MAYNTLATEGKLYKPFLVKQIKNRKNEIIEAFGPQLIRDLASETSQHSIQKKTF